MPLIKSISGIRGTIGGFKGESLTLDDIFLIISSFSVQLLKKNKKRKVSVLLARDSRVSGEYIYDFIKSILIFNGVNVLELGLATTPTLAINVKITKAEAGIMISASHNPKNWNALKFYNNLGEIDYIDIDNKNINIKYPKIDDLGKTIKLDKALKNHIDQILKLNLVKKDLVSKVNFKVIIDGINSVGVIAIPELLKSLGVNKYRIINSKMDGNFAHNPEPLKENLKKLSSLVKKEKADLGIAVDPDVDRLALIDENGEYIGEENTLVLVADYILKNNKNKNNIAISNLSSSRALEDLCRKYKAKYFASAVGERNVINLMKEKKATIGGEGNGGVIYPKLQYSRDALVGIALTLSYMASSRRSLSEIRDKLPFYVMIKDKARIDKVDLKDLIKTIKKSLKNKAKINEIDGLKIDWEDSWLHLRASNTEAILRIYAEADNLKLAEERIKYIKTFL